VHPQDATRQQIMNTIEAWRRPPTGARLSKKFRSHRPDVTLMDLQMPDMSGIDAIISTRQEFPEARIIVLTTYAGDVLAQRALKAGARRTC
jgi:DNA-binding NarL/FixJ family response regulator